MKNLTPKTRCHLRSLGHSWEEYEPLDPPEVQYGVPIHMRCTNGCGTVKYEVINRYTGMRNGRTRYIHEAGYKFEDGAPTQDELRLALLKETKRAG